VRTKAEEQLALVANNLPEGIRSRSVIATGDAADEIVRVANDEAADLIVIATHGLTGWRHLVFGSVAEKVIRHADCPVLVVPVHESKS
jgi:universal stress protein A